MTALSTRSMFVRTAGATEALELRSLLLSREPAHQYHPKDRMPAPPPRRVLVTGAGGQLASAIVAAFADRDVVPIGRAGLDVTDPVAVARTVARLEPDLVVNCAAFNDVDGAEDRPLDALAANAFAVRSLARAADTCGAALLHFGSDFVFDGRATEPYSEDARPAPRSTYAASKLLGDWFALESARGFALRVESLFGTSREWGGRVGTLDRIVEGLLAGRDVPVFTDRVVSPSCIEDVAAAAVHLVDGGGAPGLYHCVNSGHATWREVALLAADALGVQPRLKALTMDAVPMRAVRPQYCALSNAKLRAAGFAMPTWQDSVRKWLDANRRPGHRMDSIS